MLHEALGKNMFLVFSSPGSCQHPLACGRISLCCTCTWPALLYICLCLPLPSLSIYKYIYILSLYIYIFSKLVICDFTINSIVYGYIFPIFNISVFFIFCPQCTACGILVPQPGIEPASPAWEAQSLNHWTTREALFPIFYCDKIHIK